MGNIRITEGEGAVRAGVSRFPIWIVGGTPVVDTSLLEHDPQRSCVKEEQTTAQSVHRLIFSDEANSKDE